MKNVLNITGISITTWLMASVVNAVLSGTYCGIIEYEGLGFPSSVFVTLLVSLLCSAPVFFVFWVILLFLNYRKIYGRAFFRATLETGLLLSFITAVFACQVFNKAIELPVNGFIILSAISSIMLHFTRLKKIGENQEIEPPFYTIPNQQ